MTETAKTNLAIALVILCVCTAALAQTTRALPDPLDFGADGLSIPPATFENVTSPRTVELLDEALRTQPLASRRAQLVDDLGQCGLSSGMPYLQAASRDSDAMVRAEVARAVGLIGGADAQSAALLKQLVADPDALVRREAIVAAGMLQQPALVALGLRDKDAAVQAAAIERATTADHAKTIATALATTPQPLLPIAIAALGRIGDPGSRAVVAAQLQGLPAVRAAAVEALSRLAAISDLETLRRLAQADPHPLVRRQAVLAVARLSDAAGAQATALGALEDADRSVRCAAAEVLGQFPTPAAIAPMVAQLEIDQPALHERLLAALIRQGPPTLAPAQALLERPDPRRQKDAVILLGGLRSDALLQRRISLLESADLDLVAAVAESLGRAGDPKAGPALHELLKRLSSSEQANSDAATQTIVACGRIGFQPALPEIKACLGNGGRPSKSQRAAAAWAFGVLGSASDTAACQQLVALCNDPFEFDAVKFECIKALGQVRYPRFVDSLKFWLGGEDLGQSESLKWIAHWAHDRITGTATAYSPPVRRQAASVSISDLTPR